MLSREGLGVGLRAAHYPRLWERGDAGVDFFEIIAENFLGPCAAAQYHLQRARELAPIVVHGVSLNLLGPEPLDIEHLRALKALADRLDAPYVTDHLCWTAAHGHQTHDLLPVPMTPALARYAAARARQVQDFLERPFGLENLSAMAAFVGSSQVEWDFFREVVEGAGCAYLLDLNNLFVSSANTGVKVSDYLEAIDAGRILQVHLAGHRRVGQGPIVDTHDQPVRPEVWALYARAWEEKGPFPTLLEWDEALPPYDALLEEARKALHVRAATTTTDPNTRPPTPPRATPPPAPEHRARATEPLEPPEEVRRWQQRFLSLVRTPLAWEPPRASARSGDYADELVDTVVSDGIEARERLRAYHEQYWFRLLSALQGLYPTVSRLMGLWSFNQLASAYLQRHPPRERDLGAVGRALLAFLQGSPWESELLLEAASFDALWTELFELPASPAWKPLPHEMPEIASAWLRPSPSLRRLRLRWPIPALRDQALALAGEETLPPPLPDPGTWLLFRTPTLDMIRFRADPALVALLERLDEAPLGQALADVGARFGDTDPELQAKVQGWFQAGVRWGWWLRPVSGP